jgi:hypothetical protein
MVQISNRFLDDLAKLATVYRVIPIENEQVIKQNEISHSYQTSSANIWQRKSTKRTPKKGLQR